MIQFRCPEAKVSLVDGCMINRISDPQHHVIASSTLLLSLVFLVLPSFYDYIPAIALSLCSFHRLCLFQLLLSFLYTGLSCCFF